MQLTTDAIVQAPSGSGRLTHVPSPLFVLALRAFQFFE